MQFRVPQFIEHEAKILGPLTFKQIIIVAIVLAPAIICYFVLPFTLFILVSLALLGIGLLLTLGKKQGVPLLELITNFFGFNLKPRRYFWQKRERPLTAEMPIYKEKPKVPILKEEEKAAPLKIGEKSRLKKLLTEIEIYKK